MARNIRFKGKNGPPITGECDICGERTYLPFQCKKCLGIFCDKHHLPENHSCIPISKLINDYNQFCEREIPLDEREKIQNKIREIDRIITRLQSMYEGGDIGRSDYLDKLTSFKREKEELEEKLEKFDINNEKTTPVVEKNHSISDQPDIINKKYSYTVDEKYKSQYIGNVHTEKYSSTAKEYNNVGKGQKEEPINAKSRCQFCGLPIIGIPFKCRRCGFNYCNAHRLPENHWCATQKEASQHHKMKSYVKWILIIIILGIVIIGIPYFISHTQGFGQKNSNFSPTVDANKTNNISNFFSKVNELFSGFKQSENKIFEETKIKAPEINIGILEYRIHELINEKRRQNGISTLILDLKLANIARNHSVEMANRNFFDHINLQGQDPTARGLKSDYRCYKNYDSYYTEGLAENIYQNNLYDTVTYYNGIPSYDWNSLEEIAQSTVNGWMSSPGHRQNILTSTYDKEGIGVAISSDEKVLITQDFC